MDYVRLKGLLSSADSGERHSPTPNTNKVNINISAIPSKSHLHRLLICAALSDKPTFIKCAHKAHEGADIKTTINCLLALGAQIERANGGYKIAPIDRANLPDKSILPCAESGSTLRFMLPIVCALGISCELQMSGRLPERPMKHLEDELIRGGIHLWRPQANVLCCEGKLGTGEFHLPGNISSQYISGMLMALPLLDERNSLHVSEPIESEGYIDMTLEVLRAFGEVPQKSRTLYETGDARGFRSPEIITAEGDWSNAAFWLAAGALSNGNVRLSGLNLESTQGDKAICDILAQMGAIISWDDDFVCVSHGQLRGIEIDASNIPDLVPILALVASVSVGETLIYNASRLRLKESDRLVSTCSVLNTLGAKITEEADGLRIEGVPHLTGGVVDSHSDHRIAMMAGIASLVSMGDITVNGSGAVDKSYPGFWEEELLTRTREV